jgi:cysteinyl-tRNA synthetase
MLRIHNTLSGQVEEFRPLVEGEVKFYYCGPTVWDYGHIGNFRSAIAADVIRRYLKFKGYNVTQVMNLTDVDDRIISQRPRKTTRRWMITRRSTSKRFGKISTRSVASGRKLRRAPRVTSTRCRN